MTHSDVEQLLYETLLANSPTINGTPIESKYIVTPNKPEPTDKNGKTWLRTYIVWDASTQLQSGYSGLDVSIDVFSAPNEGYKIYSEVQNQLIPLFNKSQLDKCVSIYGVSPKNMGIVEGWQHYKINFTVRFTF